MTRERTSAAALPLVLLALLHPVNVASQQPSVRDTVRLTLADAQRLSLERNPSFLAASEEREVAAGDLRQVRAIAPNPQLEFGAPGAARAEGFGRYEAALSQEIEWAGQRGLRVGSAESGLLRAQETVRDMARLTVADASAAYYTALATARQLSVAENLYTAGERLLSAVRMQLDEGEISVLEADLASIEVARARARVLAARREAGSAQLALKRALGAEPSSPFILAEDIPEAPSAASLNLDSLVQAALRRRPDLQAQVAAVEEQQDLARLVRREAIPNVELRLLAERETASSEPWIGWGVGLPIPLWNRNQGAAASAIAEVRRATSTRAAVELGVRTEVADAHQAYLSASEEESVAEREVLQPSLRSLERLDTAYSEGKVDLTELLLLRNQLLDAQLSYWDSWLAHRRALVSLQSATGEIGAGLQEIDGGMQTNTPGDAR